VSETLLILASSSPRRQELIQMLGLPVMIMPSDADETVEPDWTPGQIVERLSLRKAEAVRSKAAERQGIVVGSDTIVVLDGQVLGKPRNADEAVEMLSSLSGREHRVFSGVALVDAAAGEPSDKAGDYDTTMHLGDIGQYRIQSESPDGRPEIMVGHTVSKVTFRPMSDEEIWAYVKTGDPLDKAGAYGVQGIGSVFIEKIEGDFYSIMGLPLNLLYQMLLRFGIRLFHQSLLS